MPNPVRNLVLSAAGPDVIAAWLPPADATKAGWVRSSIRYSLDGKTWTKDGEAPAPSTNYTIKGKASKPLKVRVDAVNGANVGSSAYASYEPPPIPPIGPTDPTAPTPVPQPLPPTESLIVAVQPMVPAMVHVRTPKDVTGADIEKRYSWNLPGQYPTLPGFNAAAFIDEVDDFGIGHSIDGVKVLDSVKTTEDTRTNLYLHSSGDDGNPGTEGLPKKDLAKALAAISGRKNVGLYLARGSNWTLGNTQIVKKLQNAVIGAYGSGPAPVLRMATGKTCLRLETPEGAIVENIAFDGPASLGGAKNGVVAVFTSGGRNVGMRNLEPVGNGVTNIWQNDELNPTSCVIVQNCDVDTTKELQGYGGWLAGKYITILECDIVNSTREHDFRSSTNCSYVLFHDNDLSNIATGPGDETKSTINIRTGHTIWIENNRINNAVIGFGASKDLFAKDANAGARNIVVRDNDFNVPTGAAFQANVTCSDILIEGNRFADTPANQTETIGLEGSHPEYPGKRIGRVVIRENTVGAGAGKAMKVYGKAPAFLTLEKNKIGKRAKPAIDIADASIVKSSTENVFHQPTVAVIADKAKTLGQWNSLIGGADKQAV